MGYVSIPGTQCMCMEVGGDAVYLCRSWGSPWWIPKSACPQVGNGHPFLCPCTPWLGAGFGRPGLGMQPGNPMVDDGSGFQVQPATTPQKR